MIAWRLCVLLIFASHAVASADSPVAQFRRAVEGKFTAFADLAVQYGTAKSRSLYERQRPDAASEADDAGELELAELKRRYSRSVDEFRDAVQRHWPFASESPPGVVGAFQRACRISQAYYDGGGEREAAVAAFLDVAQRFPNTAQSDESLFVAAMLHIQGLRPGVQRDRAGATELLKRLAAGADPPSSWSLLAEEELASYSRQAEDRVAARSAFLARQQERLNTDWLQQQYLTPNDQMTPETYVTRIVNVLINLTESPARTCYNVVNDARQTGNPVEAIAALASRHRQLPFIHDALSRSSPSADRTRRPESWQPTEPEAD